MGDQAYPVFDVLTDRQHAGLVPQRIDINRPPGVYAPHSVPGTRVKKTGHPRLVITCEMSANVHPIADCAVNRSYLAASLGIDKRGAAVRSQGFHQANPEIRVPGRPDLQIAGTRSES